MQSDEVGDAVAVMRFDVGFQRARFGMDLAGRIFAGVCMESGGRLLQQSNWNEQPDSFMRETRSNGAWWQPERAG